MTKDEILNQFMTHINYVEKLSKNTQEAYEKDIIDWFDFLEEIECETIATPSLQIARSYISNLTKRKLTPSTINRRISVLRKLYSSLENKDYSNPFKNIRNQKKGMKLPRALNSSTLTELLKTSLQERNSFLKARNHLIIELLFSTGARVNEISTLKIEDCCFTEDRKIASCKIKGKGNKERIIFFNQHTLNALQVYLPLRKDKQKNTNNLLLNSKGEGLSNRGIFYILEQLTYKAGISLKITPHSFRHTFATELINNGMNIRAVQEALGHSSLASTEIYSHTSLSRLKEIVRKYHPHSNKGEGKGC